MLRFCRFLVGGRSGTYSNTSVRAREKEEWILAHNQTQQDGGIPDSAVTVCDDGVRTRQKRFLCPALLSVGLFLCLSLLAVRIYVSRLIVVSIS